MGRQEIRTCVTCRKKYYLDANRQIQSMWRCPNPFCRAPQRGVNGEPSVWHDDYAATIHLFPEYQHWDDGK